MTTNHCVDFPLTLIYELDEFFQHPRNVWTVGSPVWLMAHSVHDIAESHRKKGTRLYDSWTGFDGTVHLEPK